MKVLVAAALLWFSIPAYADQPPADAPQRPERRRHWKPLMAELAGMFAIGQVWYFRNGADGNADDWDMPWSISSLGKKLTGEAWRYDDNGFVTNSVKHPVIFGAPIHALARLHGFGLAEAFAITTASSLLWETAAELREFASINDLLSTSPGGLPIGETIYQVVEHPRATRFELRTGVQQLDATSYGHVGFRADLDRVPGGRGEPADTRGTAASGKQVRLVVDRPFDAEGTRAWELESRALLGGYYRNVVDDRRHGYNFLVGAFVAFDYVHKMDRPDSAYDTFANTLVGPTVSYALYRGDWRITGVLDTSFDFAMVKPQAFEAWRESHPDDVVRGALEDNRHRYYHAFGVTVEPRVEVGFRGATLGGRVRTSYFNSIEGRDRWQEQITADIRLEDTRTRAIAWLGYEWRGAAVALEGELEARGGRVDDVTSRLSQRRMTASVGYRF